jgi:signal transduction histidine kinase
MFGDRHTMQTETSTAAQMSALADALPARHQVILDAWREMVAADSELATASTLSVLHFENRIPEVLEEFEEALRRAGDRGEGGEPERSTPGEQQRFTEHAMHRWKQGYSLREMIQEWSHLQVCVLRELEACGAAHPLVALSPEVMCLARETWLRQCGKALGESCGEYQRIQQAEAAGRLRDLEAALEEVRQLERQRAEAWHEAAHDLRGNVGLVTTTTSILAEEGVPDRLRDKAFGTLQSSVTSLHQLLEDLMSLARLEAGREQRQVVGFDASEELRRLCLTLEPVAAARGLYFHCHGPEKLQVEGDGAKVLRIVQNLALNALKYTATGGVTVIWGDTVAEGDERWRVRIEDTGPGLRTTLTTPLGQKIHKATRQSRELEDDRGNGDVEPVPASNGRLDPSTSLQPPGEGIGLSIVKRLCELLDASLEIASTESGTTVQVVLPGRYPAG